MAKWSLAVPIWLCLLLNDTPTAILHMYICIDVICLLLDRDSTAETSWEGKNSRLYNCMALDRLGYANYSQGTNREYVQHVEHSLTDRFSFAGDR